MANDINVTKIDTSGQERFQVSYTVDQAYPSGSEKTKRLLTAGTFLDRDIKINIGVPSGALSASGTASSGSASMSASGFTAASSATSYYVNLTTSAGSVTPTASVTTAGYVTSSNDKTGSAVSVSVSGNGNKLYIPAGSCTVAGGVLSTSGYTKNDLALTLSSGSETNLDNTKFGSQDTTNYPYYFKITGSTPAVSGSTSAAVTAITDTHTAGYIPAKATTNFRNAQNASPAVSVNGTSASTYLSLKKATGSVTMTAGNGSCELDLDNSSNVTLQTADNGIKVTFKGRGQVSASANTSAIGAGYLPANTNFATGTSTWSGYGSLSRYISGITVPGTTSFNLTLSAFSGGNIGARGTVDITNGVDRLINITNAVSGGDLNITQSDGSTTLIQSDGYTDIYQSGGDIDLTLEDDASGTISIDAYYNDSNSTYESVVTGGRWKTTTITPSSSQQIAYGRVVVNAVSGSSLIAGEVVNPATLPSGATATTIARGNYIKISSGTYGSDLYYQAQPNNLGTKTITSSGTGISVDGYTAVNVASASPSFTGGGVTATINDITGSNVTVDTTNNGIAVTASGTYERAAVTYNGAVSGWVSKANGDSALAKINSTAMNNKVKYITGITVPKDIPFSLSTIADTALDTTSNVTITHNAYRNLILTSEQNSSTEIHNKGNINLTQYSSSYGDVTVAAFTASNTRPSSKIVENGYWKTVPITPSSSEQIAYGRVVVAAVSESTPAAGTITNNVTTLPTGISSSGTINRGQYIKIGAGNYGSDLYYRAQPNSGTLTITQSGSNISVDGYAAVNIAAAAGSVTMNAGSGYCDYYENTNLTVDTSNTSGCKITFAGYGAVSATAKITTAGYTTTTNSFATGALTNSSTAYTARYITGAKLVPPTSGSRSFTLQIPNGSTTSFISLVFTTDASGNVTVTES